MVMNGKPDVSGLSATPIDTPSSFFVCAGSSARGFDTWRKIISPSQTLVRLQHEQLRDHTSPPTAMSPSRSVSPEPVRSAESTTGLWPIGSRHPASPTSPRRLFCSRRDAYQSSIPCAPGLSASRHKQAVGQCSCGNRWRRVAMPPDDLLRIPPSSPHCRLGAIARAGIHWVDGSCSLTCRLRPAAELPKSTTNLSVSAGPWFALNSLVLVAVGTLNSPQRALRSLQ